MKLNYRMACGGLLPRSGKGIEKQDLEPGDTFRLGVDGLHQKMDRPIMPDGKDAPCLFFCPVKRLAKRQDKRVWRDTPDGKGAPDATLVTCMATAEAAP